MIYLLKSYLDLTVSPNNDNMSINRYKLVSADHTGNVIRGDMCVCLF